MTTLKLFSKVEIQMWGVEKSYFIQLVFLTFEVCSCTADEGVEYVEVSLSHLQLLDSRLNIPHKGQSD